MKEWLKNNSLTITAGIVIAFVTVGMLTAALLTKQHRAALDAAKPVVVAEPVVPDQVQKAAPVPVKRAEREQSKKTSPKSDRPQARAIGPSTSKDCAGLTVAACTAKRKDACEKASGKPCVVDPSAKRHW